jgi:general secretion pathway protein I
MKGNKDRKGNSGFTLFEVLVAISIMGIAIAAVLQLYSANLRALSSSEEYILASLRGETKMREILLREELEEGTWSEESEDGYRFEITVTEAQMERTEYLPVRLLRVDLTVFYQVGGREKSLLLSTMNAAEKST